MSSKADIQPYLNDAEIMRNVYNRKQYAYDVVLKSSLVREEYDYIGKTNPSASVETYTYKSGGASGTVVATITVTYTDSTKADIASVARS